MLRLARVERQLRGHSARVEVVSDDLWQRSPSQFGHVQSPVKPKQVKPGPIQCSCLCVGGYQGGRSWDGGRLLWRHLRMRYRVK